MRPFSVAALAIVISLLSKLATAEGRDCAAGVSDLSEMITCLKQMHRPLLQNCEKAKQESWIAPVESKRVLDFGDKTQYGTLSKGIVCETQQGVVPRAPVAGLVIYAGEYRSYGKLVILDACSVDLLFSGLDTLSVRVGQTVQASDDLGRMARSSGFPLPVLYFEVRASGRQIDPNAFLR